MSASRRPTLAPVWDSATARLTLVVLLPTPPLPDATATTFLTRGMSGVWLAAGPPRAAAVLAVIVTWTSVTHGRLATAMRAWFFRSSLTGQAGVGRITSKATAPLGSIF